MLLLYLKWLSGVSCQPEIICVSLANRQSHHQTVTQSTFVNSPPQRLLTLVSCSSPPTRPRSHSGRSKSPTHPYLSGSSADKLIFAVSPTAAKSFNALQVTVNTTTAATDTTRTSSMLKLELLRARVGLPSLVEPQAALVVASRMWDLRDYGSLAGVVF